MPMSTFMSWLFHRRTNQGSGEAARTSHALLEEEAEQVQPVASLTAEVGSATGRIRPSAGSLFINFEALAHRESALLEGLTPLTEQAALVSFVGTGITEPDRYENAAAAFDHLRLLAPPNERARIQVFRQQLRPESEGDDFLYVHFAGDPLSFGFLICTLTGGGLMAGWKLG